MAKRTSRKTLREMQPTSYICARCSREHNGSGPPPGWGHAPGHGLICDDCDEQLHTANISGIRRPVGKGKRHAA
jgi:hypothetical protein